MPDLPAGPELDRLVALAVGWEWKGGDECGRCSCEIISCYAQQRVGDTVVGRWPSEEIADAIAALEALDIGFQIEFDKGGYKVMVPFAGKFWHFANTLPHAAALAIVRWGEAREGKGNG